MFFRVQEGKMYIIMPRTPAPGPHQRISNTGDRKAAFRHCLEAHYSNSPKLIHKTLQ
jgi:hypothetical protein